MRENDRYETTDWYAPLKRSKRGVKNGKKGGWTPVRIAGVIVLVLLLIAGSSLAFARSPRPSVHVSWNDAEDPVMPDSKEEFFENFYQSVDGPTEEINVPTVALDSDYRMELETPREQELTLQELYRQCAQSIVAIYGYVDGEVGYYWGSGVILSEDGLILTNEHVLEGCDSASVKLFDNSEYEAQLVGADAPSDIALLKIDAENLSPAKFGESVSLAVGDRVAAIGNPLGEQFRMTMTDGIVSAIERGVNIDGRSMTLLQTNTALNEGNSGGALFNMYGQVVGITNMKMVSAYSPIEGIAFAIPTTLVRSVVNALVEDGAVWGRPSIGITVGAIPKNAAEAYDLPAGLYVSGVQENSDAAKEGMQVGDIITEVNYQPVTSTGEVEAIKNTLEVGDIMIFTVWRDGETMEIEVKLLDTNTLYH